MQFTEGTETFYLLEMNRSESIIGIDKVVEVNDSTRLYVPRNLLVATKHTGNPFIGSLGSDEGNSVCARAVLELPPDALSASMGVPEQRKAPTLQITRRSAFPCCVSGLVLKVSLVSTGFMGDGREKERSVGPEGDCTDGRRRRREGESRERRGARRSTPARRSSEEGPRNQPWTGV